MEQHMTRTRTGQVSPGSFVGPRDLSSLRVRLGLHGSRAVVAATIVLAGIGPLVWLALASLNTTQSVLRNPMTVWRTPTHWENYAAALSSVGLPRYLANSLVIGLGTVAATLFVSVTAAYVIAILRPRWAGLLSAAIVGTLFLPAVVLLVPLYLTVSHLPLTGTSLLNTYWGVWLPAGANAFGVLLLATSFRTLPREIIEAARLDGAGNPLILVRVVLPLSRPMLGVASLLAFIGSWKDFLWPYLVLTDAALQPVSVALPQIQKSTDLSAFLATLLLASLVPIALFFVFSRQILAGVAATSALKE
jgi:multiple sugar transport system permease protein